MTTIAVTGATGHLGRLVVLSLLDRGVAADRIVAVVRDRAKARDLAERGVEVRVADYTDPDALRAAFDGIDRLLLVSSSVVGQREPQHANVIAAAEAAGVGLLAYTSILNADTTTMRLAAEHQATERRLAASTLPTVVLRNGWYVENYTGQLDVVFEHGLLGSAGDGRFQPAARAEYAEAAAAVLAGGDEHAGRVYELAGDQAVTLGDVADALADASGRSVAYVDLPVDRYAAVLVDAGLPEALAGILADASAAIARGELSSDSGDLARLIGRPTAPVADVIRDIVAAD